MKVTCRLHAGVSALVNGRVLWPQGHGTVGASSRLRTRYPLVLVACMLLSRCGDRYGYPHKRRTQRGSGRQADWKKWAASCIGEGGPLPRQGCRAMHGRLFCFLLPIVLASCSAQAAPEPAPAPPASTFDAAQSGTLRGTIYWDG